MKKRFLLWLSVGLLMSSTTLGWSWNPVYARSDSSLHRDAIYINSGLAPYFSDYNGTFLFYDENKRELEVYNPRKSLKRVSPNSTFKIPHSLIALQSGVLKNEKTVWEWDGTPNPFESWNRDHDMRSAIADSVVWYYQRIAGRVGEERMSRYLNALAYGNRDLSGGLTQFWLQSSLTISPMEQMDFLHRLYHDQLPFSKRNMNIVRDILILEKQPSLTLSGKTGSGFKGDWEETINGWFVGVVEQEGKRYFFVTHIEGEHASGSKAKAITLDILKDKGLYWGVSDHSADESPGQHSCLRSLAKSA